MATLQIGHGSDWHSIGNSLPFPFKDANGKQLGYEVFAMKILKRERSIVVGGSFQGNGFRGIAMFDANLQEWNNMNGGFESSVTIHDVDQENGVVYAVGYSFQDSKTYSRIYVWNLMEKKWSNFEVSSPPSSFSSASLRKVRVFSNADGSFMVISSESDLYVVDIKTRKCYLLFSIIKTMFKTLQDFLIVSQKDNSISIVLVGGFVVNQLQNSVKIEFSTSSFNIETKPFGTNNSIAINSIVFDPVSSKYYAATEKGAALSLDSGSDPALTPWKAFGNSIGYMSQIFTLDGEIFIGKSDCSSKHPFYRFDKESQTWKQFLLESIGDYENCLLKYWITTESGIVYDYDKKPIVRASSSI